MVRLKHRYILFDVLYPPIRSPTSRDEQVKFETFGETPKDCLLQLHAPTSSSVTARSLSALFKRVIDDHFGELASGTVGSSIIVKYFSNKTSTGIIRCSRTDFEQVMAAIGLITKVDTRDVVMRCVHVSGTIRKCEDFSIRRSRKLMAEMGKEESESDISELIAMFRSADDEEE